MEKQEEPKCIDLNEILKSLSDDEVLTEDLGVENA